MRARETVLLVVPAPVDEDALDGVARDQVLGAERAADRVAGGRGGDLDAAQVRDRGRAGRVRADAVPLHERARRSRAGDPDPVGAVPRDHVPSPAAEAADHGVRRSCRTRPRPGWRWAAATVPLASHTDVVALDPVVRGAAGSAGDLDAVHGVAGDDVAVGRGGAPIWLLSVAAAEAQGDADLVPRTQRGTRQVGPQEVPDDGVARGPDDANRAARCRG